MHHTYAKHFNKCHNKKSGGMCCYQETEAYTYEEVSSVLITVQDNAKINFRIMQLKEMNCDQDLKPTLI